jgi:hypothetical protein
MYFTAFTPFFFLFVVFALRGIPQWGMATLVASFFQGASPLLVVGGGRVSGIAPAYALLGIGVLHGLLLSFRQRDRHKAALIDDAASVWMLLFTLVGVVGAVFLPRVLDGQVEVLSPRFGLESTFTDRLHPSSGNYIQAFYVTCNCVLFLLLSYFVRIGRMSIEQCLRGLAVGAGLSAAIGLYQVAAYYLYLPWPDGIINSNLGLKQLAEQTAFGMQRMSATFMEPTVMSLHFLGVFALFGLGLRRWRVGGLLLLCLLISTSSNAYAGLFLIVMLWTAVELPRLGTRILPVVLLMIAAAGAGYLADLIWMDGRLTDHFIAGKLSSGSGMSRAHADYLALQAMLDSYGLGVGVGSARGSSFLTTLAATVGLPGLVCLGGLLFTTLAACFRRPANEQHRAFGYAILAMLISWTLSVPDLALPLGWLVMGIANGMVSRSAVAAAPAGLLDTVPSGWPTR